MTAQTGVEAQTATARGQTFAHAKMVTAESLATKSPEVIEMKIYIYSVVRIELSGQSHYLGIDLQRLTWSFRF